ncbi:MAG: hypothetical protein ACOC58_03370 [Chloroflexota bacterium]
MVHAFEAVHGYLGVPLKRELVDHDVNNGGDVAKRGKKRRCRRRA